MCRKRIKSKARVECHMNYLIKAQLDHKKICRLTKAKLVSKQFCADFSV